MEFKTPPPAAPPSYTEAMGGVQPSAPLAQQHTIIPGPAIITTIIPLGPNSTHMVCPYCRSEVMTSTRSSPGLVAYVSGIVIALLGCVCGCCLIPCCFRSCMDVHHTCPQCKAHLGEFRHRH